MELSSCRAQRGVIADIAQLQVVEPKAAEKLPQIDAEQLIEELKQLDKPPPPLPQPQPQPQPQQQPPPPPPPPPQQPKTRPQQVVETVKPNTEQAPDNARFLSEHNIKVDKQKVNRGARNEPMVAKAKPEELTAKKDPSKEENAIAKPPPEMAPGKNEKAPENPGKLSMRKPGVQTPSQQQQDAKTKGVLDPDRPLAMDGYRPRPGQGEVSQEKKERGELPTPGENGAGGGTPPMPNLKPSKDQLERALGGGSVDHLEEVENGDETALSSKRWVYASFFNRLKRQVAQNWDPQTVWRRSDPQGTHYGFKTRVTEVRVTLGAKGELAKIVVTSPSGSNELDEEALRSFKAAQPFPNPPEELIAQGKGQMTFAFSFFFEINQSRTSWRVIRQ
jgi:TonB family protein